MKMVWRSSSQENNKCALKRRVTTPAGNEVPQQKRKTTQRPQNNNIRKCSSTEHPIHKKYLGKGTRQQPAAVATGNTERRCRLKKLTLRIPCPNLLNVPQRACIVRSNTLKAILVLQLPQSTQGPTLTHEQELPRNTNDSWCNQGPDSPSISDFGSEQEACFVPFKSLCDRNDGT